MSLFQNSVLNKYLKGLDSRQVEQAWNKYTAHFHNPTIQENIRNSKEEQYQEGFLRDLFVNIFGYILNPETNFNLTTELKNLKGAKKTDGAILQDDKALAVIELKGTNTVDLAKVETQAFGYKNNQPDCMYVITSNFEKLRFYIDNAVDFEEFNLFNLNKTDFEKLYLCLAAENLLKDIPKQIKDESLTQEENVTKKLYKDYSQFRNEIFDSIQKNNSDYDKLTLFKKTQKLLDRFLFIFFAEDRLLLPPNSIREIVNQWTDLRDKYDEYQPLYDRFKKYFGYMNTGHKGQKHDIFAYNGGLFAPDDILDNIKIDDELLYKHTLNLSHYDFESEVSVNILGHIFEHSLTEIENIQAQLEGTEIDKSKTKRKKDGVFYTPKYITKYIVDNTVGKLCEKKKTELDIQETDYEKERKGRKKATLTALQNKLDTYRKWLLQLTICDPACGSGAFLNQALEFLIAEHRYIDELKAKLLGYAMIFSEVQNAILENNLFGVDINEESVEIAKLSLWLRTAQKGRKLTTLNSNIKCGNSLIDDPEVAGDKAFNWDKEFPEIFAKGGFDVVIGNPPYVSHDRIDNKNYLQKNYKTYQAFADLFCFFYELGIRILKTNGTLSYITSNSFLKADYGKPLREYFIAHSTIKELINIEETQIFSDAIVNSVITTLRKSKDSTFKARIVNSIYDTQTDFWAFIESNKFSYQQSDFDYLSWNLIRPEVLKLRNKIKGTNPTLEDLNTKIRLGLATGSNQAFVISEDKKTELIGQDSNSKDLIEPLLRGRDINRYSYELPNLYLLLTKNGVDVSANYPAIFNHLDSFGDKFKQRGAKGQHWTNLRACSFFDDFKKEKIVWIELTDKGRFSKSIDEIYLLNSAYFLIPPENIALDYLLAILNSKLIEFYLKQIANTSGMGTTRWINIYVKEFPIAISDKQKEVELSNLSVQISDFLGRYNSTKGTFSKYLTSKYSLEKLTKKLQNWYELEFGDFIKELNKAIKKAGGIKLTKSDEMEWMQLFETKRAEAQALKSEVGKTDRQIDQMVYALYGLTEDEIKIVEGS